MRTGLWAVAALLICSALCAPADATTYYVDLQMSAKTDAGTQTENATTGGTYRATSYCDEYGSGFGGVTADATARLSGGVNQLARSLHSEYPAEYTSGSSSASLDVLFWDNTANGHAYATLEIAEQRWLIETADGMTPENFYFAYDISLGASVAGVSTSLFESSLSYYSHLDSYTQSGFSFARSLVEDGGSWEIVFAPYTATYDLGLLEKDYGCQLMLGISARGGTVDREGLVNFTLGDPASLAAGLDTAGITLTGTLELEQQDDPDTGAIPEPATLTLFGLGLAGAALARRRRKHAA